MLGKSGLMTQYCYIIRLTKLVCCFSIILSSAVSGNCQYSNVQQAKNKESLTIIDREKDEFKLSKMIVPAAFIATGSILNIQGPDAAKKLIVRERNEHLGQFRTYVDDYLQFSPIVLAYGLDICGVKSKNDFINKTAILIKGEAMMFTISHSLKYATNMTRPDHSNNHSFPSGHTAQAFAAATFLSMEYKDNYPWIPVVSYGIASSVGLLRMANNKHYISDVLLGAGIGILSMQVSYYTHRYKWKSMKKEVKAECLPSH